jgi:superfamily II DNA/RNA helicase
MNRLPAGVAGSASDDETGASNPSAERSALLQALLRGRAFRPVQRQAFQEARILDSRRNLVVCAPTNSGKTLVAQGLLLDVVQRGARAVLLEPLRALAQEQSDQLSEVLATLPAELFPISPSVVLSTGDYRLDDESMAAPPPSSGEVIVATPERFDAVLRNPAYESWIDSIAVLVVDEAHLLADPRRGPTVEAVVASMLSRSVPPRIALLSATLGTPERLKEWLNPCDLILSSARSPLTKEVWQLEQGESADEILVGEVTSLLRDLSSAVIVFVYRRNDTEALSKLLTARTSHNALPYHSGQSSADRARVRVAFQNGICRCLVSTTALALGVNLPATHVIVRDSTFFSEGRLPVDQLLQILGRAGRGNRPGLGAVMVRCTDGWRPEELAESLKSEKLATLKSSFERSLSLHHRRGSLADGARLDGALAGVIATSLSRSGDQGLGATDVSRFLSHTLSGAVLTGRSTDGLRWLMDPSRALAYRTEESRYRMTVLGSAGLRSMLPLDYVAGLGRLIRDLISLDPLARLLNQWSALDHLFVMALLSERTPAFRRFSEDLAEQIDGFLESRPPHLKSLLFTTWVMGSPAGSKADELFGSLGLSAGAPTHPDTAAARKRAYVAMLAAVVLDERSQGATVEALEDRWSVLIGEGAEEGWRDTALWLLGGHAQVSDLRCFYHHLKETNANSDQTQAVKSALRKLRVQSYELVQRIKYCSPLGPLVKGIRTSRGTGTKPQVGVGTIATLEAAGVKTIRQVAFLDVEQLVALGVQRRFAKQIRAYVHRRQR